MKILLVDDDMQIADLISRQLERNSYVVEIASSGEYAIDLLRVNPYSLLLLDVILPRLSGIEVCRKIRNQGDQIPILMLTGQGATRDKVSALDSGADDYMVKPFELDELTARVRALLRRNSDVSSTLLQYGELKFDPASQHLTYQDKPIALRPKEIAILELMLRYPTRVFEADVLLERLWNLADCPDKATIKTHIRSLRKQLNAAGAHNVIETLYGRGYRLNPEFLPSRPSEQLPRANASANCPYAGNHEANKDNQRSPIQRLIAQTWEEVQTLSWRRLSRLKSLVRSLQGSSQTTPLPMSCQIAQWQQTLQEATGIAHHLKGSLGSFGFQAASLQAGRIETALLNMMTASTVSMQIIQAQVNLLEQLLSQRMTHPPFGQSKQPDERPISTAIPQVLIVSHDCLWMEQLRQPSQDLNIQVETCSPLTIDIYLLKQTPTAIVLDLSAAENELDLALLDVLVSNYGEHVPILGVVPPQSKERQLLALQRGAVACIQKTWSLKTLFTIVAEYTLVEISAMELSR